MLQSYSLYTSEIDDLQSAIDEILGQVQTLDLLANTVGILVCHYDFIGSGIVQVLAKKLPFPIIGITTFYQATSRVNGLFELTLTVLTSDTVSFAVAGSGMVPEKEIPANIIRQTYAEASCQHEGKPAFILGFLSNNRPCSGDEFLRLVDEYSGNVPYFGSVTIGDDDMGTNSYVICRDDIFFRGFAFLLMFGNVDIQYGFGNFKKDNFLEMTATVTKAQGTAVKELNGLPATAFLQKNGFVFPDSERERISNIPCLFKPPGGEYWISRTLSGFTDDGDLRFLGEIPQQSIFRVGTASVEDVLDVSQATVRQVAKNSPNACFFMMFSCVGRYITLGLELTSEMECAREVLPEKATYLTCYVGGEMCPIGNPGNTVNCYHNASFIVCALS